MIDRKQASELLNNAQHANRINIARLEAIYSAADAPTKAILDKHEDLRPRLHNSIESDIRAHQDRKDYQRALNAIREELDPDLKTKSEDGADQDHAERG